MQNSGALNPPKTREELTQYEQGWADMMVDIWHEQMASLKAVDTGRLYASVRGSVTEGDVESITHQFVQYGIYVNAGTGREFGDKFRDYYNKSLGVGNKLGNGWLVSQDDSLREELGMNRPRKRGPKWGGGWTTGNKRGEKPWFDKKYIYSLYRLREVVQASYGEQYQSMTIEALHAIFENDARAYTAQNKDM